MRGRRLAALALSVSLLSGCGWMEHSYVSVTPHQVDLGQTAAGDARTISSYTELRGVLVDMIDAGSTEGLFSLAGYPREDVDRDMERAVHYAMETYPVGAYAVEAIDYDFGTGLGASALSVDISYRHSREEIAQIRTVRWISGAEAVIAEELNEGAEELVLQITGYEEADFARIVRDYAQQNPDRVMETPGVAVRVFPDRGDTRVLELTFYYRTDREELRSMREQVQPVFSSAALYVSGQAEDRTKFQQLYTFLTERFDYTIRSTPTPAYSLLCQGIGDSRAFSLVYAAMCRRIGLEALCINGTRDGAEHWWNLVELDGSWYHLDLLGEKQFQTLTDAQMTGYEWDRQSWPAAGAPEE